MGNRVDTNVHIMDTAEFQLVFGMSLVYFI